ncbi:MAG: response regulator [Cellvibrionaceae bacterium]|nr:response regulator [Cellvibrionaceae bacterium]
MYKALIALLRKKTTIKLRIYLFSWGMLCLFYITSIVSFITYLDDAKDEKIKSIEFAVNEILSKTAAHGLRRGNKQALLSIADTLLASTEIIKIVVVDDRGELFLQQEKPRHKPSSTIRHLTTDIHWNRIAADFNEIDTDHNSVNRIETRIGQLQVAIDQTAIADLVWNTLLEKSYLLFISLFLSMPLVYIMVSSLVKPLRDIMAYLHSFEQGDYAANAPQRKYADEYAALLNALNAAGRAIVNKQQEIEQKNHVLEEHADALSTQMAIALESSKAADEAHIRKELIIANISQEIKRPLKGIISGLNLMEDSIYEILAKVDDIDADKHFNQQHKIILRNDIFRVTKSLGMVKYGSNEINELFHELGVLTASHTHPIKLNEAVILFNSHFIKLMQEHEAVAQQNGLHFVLDYDHDDTIFIYVDWIRLAQIINIMVGNAIRFTEQGTITVKASVTRARANAVNMQIEVSDTGIGMSKTERDTIMDMLNTHDYAMNYLDQGIGTGLMIAKKVAHSLGGHILLTSSTAERGSCFRFEATFKGVQADALPPPNTPYNPHLSASPTILYVEDSKVNQIIFQKYCMAYGSKLIIANTVEEGLKKYAQIRFDAVVIDCNMPVGNSFSMAADIRAQETLEENRRVLIVALTASDSERTKNKCLSYGFDEVIPKPYTDETYKRILEKIQYC